MRVLRIVFSMALLLIVIAVVAIVSLSLFINPDKLKPIIASELKNQTGYEATIDGQFSWSFYPRLGVKVDHIALHVPKQPVPFVDLHGVTFVTDIGQLLHGNQKLRGDIYIANVKLINIQAQNAHVGLHWQDQILTLQPITADLYSGSLSGIAHGKNLSLQPNWDWDMQVTNVELQPLLEDVNGNQGKLKMTGLGQIKLKGSAQGKSREQILGSLNGATEFSLKNGVITGIDLNYLIRSADAIINRQPVTLPTTISQTAFDNFTGTALIRNGVVATNDIALNSPAFVTSGAGSINLNFNAINFQLRVVPQKDIKTQWAVPVMVTGNLFSPDVRLDVTELNIMVAKEKIEKAKVKISNEIKRHIPGKTGELLQHLLGE